MSRRLHVLGLGLLAMAQLAVPILMIATREATLRHGARVLFHTAPVDPYDAFRGRYVALAVEPARVAAPTEYAARPGRPMYLALQTDTNGFVVAATAHPQPPPAGLYLKVRAGYEQRGSNWVSYPFDRYYLNEADAPAAAYAYNRLSRAGAKQAHIAVRVRRGRAVLEELYLDDLPVAAYLHRNTDDCTP